MAKNLVIVESPAKVKTIRKFLGSRYDVEASMGHVRDLPKSQLGIDVEHDFEPKYITIRGKGDLLARLRREAKNADHVFLATDPDREGEAISWHLVTALNLDPKKMRRITFNEITKNAVRTSLKNPRDIDMNLVNAQQARRVLPSEYWTLDALLQVPGQKKPLEAKFFGTDRKMTVSSKEEMDRIVRELEQADFTVSELRRGERVRKPPLPFTTSTLQQDASNRLGFSTSKTMRVAQQLYEGVDLEGEGTVGIITYLRTDSTRVAGEAETAAEAFITEQYGAEYYGHPQGTNHNRNAQDAHEAIRPTDIRRTPASVRDSLSREQFRLYQLIWRRFAASRMAAAVYDTAQVKIAGGPYTFTASASRIRFAGFLDVYAAEDEEKSASGMMLKNLEKGMKLEMTELRPEQHFTQPPAHFTEASLVRTLEEKGIGRPSTYAPTISTILARHYITKEQKNLYLTELGEVVDGIMLKAFPQIVDENFTANLETLLDGVAMGRVDWKTIVRNFYPDLEEEVSRAKEELAEVKIEDEETDVVCENCGRHMVIKYGPHGKFLACPGFPECRNTKPYFEKVGVRCPLCGGEVVLKRTRKGRRYYGCENNPACTFMSWSMPVEKSCPKCGHYMIRKGSKIVCSDPSCGYSEDV